MPATDAYEQNDYQGYNTRPAELPLNDMFKAVQAKNDYWNMGAYKVKSAYDNALGLNLTLDANKDVKNSYMLKAQDQIKQLSSMDMGDYNVQQQGMNLFTPLLSDESIQYDNAITTRLHSIYSDANNYKNQLLQKGDEKGDGYSDANLKYALKDFSDFNNTLSRDPNNLKSIYSRVQNASYTPYYNPAQENDKIMKDCGKSSSTKQSVDPSNGMYFDIQTDSGANPQQVNNCLQTGLSDRAKNQIFIDSWAKYQNNPSYLADAVADKYTPIVSGYNRYIATNKGSYDALINKPNKTDADLQNIQTYQMMINSTLAKTKTLKAALQARNSGDYGYFKDNYDGIANQLGYEEYINNASDALRTDNIVRKQIENPVGMSIYGWNQKFLLNDHEFNHQLILQNDRLQGEKQIEMMRLMHTGQGGKGLSDRHIELDGNGNYVDVLNTPVPHIPGDNTDNNIQKPTEYANSLDDINSLTNNIYSRFSSLKKDIDVATGGDKGIMALSDPLMATGTGGKGTPGLPIMGQGLTDYNGDGKIDMKDFIAWNNDFTKSLSSGNPDWKNAPLTDKTRIAAQKLDEFNSEVIPMIRELYVKKYNHDLVEKTAGSDYNNIGQVINGVRITPKMLADAKNGISTNPHVTYVDQTNSNAYSSFSADGIQTGPTSNDTRYGYLLNGVPINDALTKSGLLTKSEEYNEKREKLFHDQRLNTDLSISPGSYPSSENNFSKTVENAIKGAGDYRVVLDNYNGIRGGGATFKLQVPIQKKNDTDGSVDGVIDAPFGDVALKALKGVFGDRVSNVHGTNLYTVKNDPIVDRDLGKYDDGVSKRIEKEINAIEYSQDIVHGIAKNEDKKRPIINIPDGESIFGNTSSTPITYISIDPRTGNKIGVVNVDIRKRMGQNVYDVRTANNTLAALNGVSTYYDIKSLIDHLTNDLHVQ